MSRGLFAVVGDSIAGRLVGIAGLGLAVALGGGGLALAHGFRSALEQGFDARLEATLLSLAASLRVGAQGTLETVRPLGDPRFDRVLSGWYWTVESSGEVLLASRSLWDDRLEPLATGAGGAAFVRGPEGRRLRAWTRTLTIPGHGAPVRLRVAGDPAEIDEEVERVTALALLAAGATAALWLFWLFAQLRFGLRPLSRLSRDVRRLRAGEIERLPDAHSRELRPLVESLNDLLAHDAALVERARARAGDLAHALRTRLSLLLADLEDRDPHDADALRVQVESMRRTVERHLARAAIAGPAPGGRAGIPVADAARALAASLRKLFPEARIEVDATPEAHFAGDPEDLDEILGNLAENACKWARGRVRIRARPDALGAGWLVLEVEDDGPGFPAEEGARALDRGARLDEQVPGTGLGLAIVQDVLEAYGGRLALETSELGGLAARVRLPATPSPRHSPIA